MMSSPTLKTSEELEDRRRETRLSEEERRNESRQRVILAGIVIFPGEETGRTVTILNRSTRGAKLRIGDVGLLPQTFTLIDQRAALAHVCQVRWRSMPFVGVSFAKSIDLSKEDEKLARQLRAVYESTRG